MGSGASTFADLPRDLPRCPKATGQRGNWMTDDGWWRLVMSIMTALTSDWQIDFSELNALLPTSESPKCTSVFGLSLWKIKKTFLFFSFEFELEFELELVWKLEWLEGVSKTLERLVYFAPYFYGGPPYNYNAKCTSPPQKFLTLPQVIPTSIPTPIPIPI